MVARKAIKEQLARDAEVVFKKVNISCKAGMFYVEDPPDKVSQVEEDDSPNHNTASSGKPSLGGEVGGIRSTQPNMVGQDGILEIAEVDVELEVIAKTYDAWVKNWSDTKTDVSTDLVQN